MLRASIITVLAWWSCEGLSLRGSGISTSRQDDHRAAAVTATRPAQPKWNPDIKAAWGSPAPGHTRGAFPSDPSRLPRRRTAASPRIAPQSATSLSSNPPPKRRAAESPRITPQSPMPTTTTTTSAKHAFVLPQRKQPRAELKEEVYRRPNPGDLIEQKIGVRIFGSLQLDQQEAESTQEETDPLRNNLLSPLREKRQSQLPLPPLPQLSKTQDTMASLPTQQVGAGSLPCLLYTSPQPACLYDAQNKRVGRIRLNSAVGPGMDDVRCFGSKAMVGAINSRPNTGAAIYRAGVVPGDALNRQVLLIDLDKPRMSVYEPPFHDHHVGSASLQLPQAALQAIRLTNSHKPPWLRRLPHQRSLTESRFVKTSVVPALRASRMDDAAWHRLVLREGEHYIWSFHLAHGDSSAPRPRPYFFVDQSRFASVREIRDNFGFEAALGQDDRQADGWVVIFRALNPGKALRFIHKFYGDTRSEAEMIFDEV